MTEPTFKHCDDYIDDELSPVCLRAFLSRARSPGHGLHSPEPFPKLFATYCGKQEWRDIKPGDRVRVVMASRMGDVGVTKNLDAEHGYDARFPVEDLADFKDSP